mgnify:FL=1
MLDQMEAFTKHRTTMSTRYEIPEQIEFPTMTLCLHPGMKNSVKEKYGLVENHFVFGKLFRVTDNPNYIGPPNQTLIETLEELSFILNRDFKLWISHKNSWTLNRGTYLKPGLNLIPVKGHRYNVTPMTTIHFGTCYRIQPSDSGSSEWKNVGQGSRHVHIWIKPIRNYTRDYPKGFDIYFTSNETWHGVIRNHWKRFKPTKKHVIGGQKWDIILRNIEGIFEDGITNSTRCHTKMMLANANCSFNCDVFGTSSLPSCKTYDEFDCMGMGYKQTLASSQLRDDCLRHKVVKTFDPTYRLWSANTKNNASSYLRISFESKDTEIIEEIDVISFANLLGSIGGSMGMFFGFSISGCVLWLLDNCFNRLSKK